MRSIDAARRLAPTIESRAAEAETRRTVPADLVAQLRAAGLFRIAVPAALGGLELDPTSVIEVVEEVSRADGSIGWSTLIGNSVAFFAWLEPEVARSLLGDGLDAISTGVFGPTGRARRAGVELLELDGRWTFNSGCLHATWYQTGFLVMDGDRPATRSDGRPDWRFAYYRADEAEVIDTWRAAGLRGTGSHDVAVQGLRLPEAHTAMPMFDPPRIESPLLGLGFRAFTTVLLVGFPLGVARRALDEVVEVAGEKRRWTGDRSLAEDAHVQRQLGRAEGALRSARAFVMEAFGAAGDGVAARGEASAVERSRMLLATQQAMDAAIAAVDLVHPLVGASTVLDGDPIGRCFRDLHAARQHVMFSGELFAEYGRDRLGIEPTPTVVRRAVPAVA